MKLSPLEIRRHEFAVRMRGFDREEVKLFLDQLSSDWEAVLEEERRAKARIEELEAKLNHYQKVEEALQEALRTARENAVKTQENAKAQAEIILEEARLKAKEIVQRAEEDKREIEKRGRELVAEAQAEKAEVEEEARARRQKAEQERTGVVLEIARLTDRRNHIQARLRSFLIAEMEMLAKFEEADPVGYIKFLPTVGRVPDAEDEPASSLSEAEDATGEEGGKPSSDPPREARYEDADSEEEGAAAEVPEGEDPEAGERTSEEADGAESDARAAADEEAGSYTVREVVRPPQAEDEAEGEMDKIRQMLKNLD